MLTTTDASNLNVGDWVSPASLDVEYFGYPPTPQQFEFVRISAITQYAAANATSVTYDTNAGTLTVTFAAAPFGAAIGKLLNGVDVPISGLTGTGVSSLNATWPILNTQTSGTVINFRVPRGLGSLTIGGGTLAATAIITIEQSLRYGHLPTFPDDGVFPNIYPVGAGARLATELRSRRPSMAYPFPSITWDIDHEYYNMHLGFPFVQYQAWPMVGRRIVDVDSVVGGYTESRRRGSPSRSARLCSGRSEPDKWVGEISYDNPMMYNPGIAPYCSCRRAWISEPDRTGLDQWRKVQRRAHYRSGQGLLLSSCGHQQSCDILLLSGLPTGMFSTLAELAITMLGHSPLGFVGDRRRHAANDRRNQCCLRHGGRRRTSSAAGVLTVLKSAFPSGVGAWNAVPGMTVNLTAP